MPEYPRRDAWFAHKVVRLMIRVCAAQEIGTNGFLLVTVVAHTEDAKRYSSAVTFWNEQLMSVLGFESWSKLDRARKRAVDAGWLHYEAGGKAKVGKYWTMIPDRFAGLEAGPVDCDASFFFTENGDDTRKETGEKQGRSRGETRENQGTNGEHSSPSPNQEPHGPRSMDHECGSGKPKTVVQASDISQAALTIFEDCGYSGNQGGNLWKIAALLDAGIVSEGEVASACRGAKLNGKDKPAHMYACLKESLAKRGEDLGALLKAVRIEPKWPKSPPAVKSERLALKRVAQEREKTPEDLRRELAALLQEAP